jgi:hypothetical protein
MSAACAKSDEQLQLQHLRCYFLKSGHIVGVEEMLGLSEFEAIEKGRTLFETRKTAVDGFEIWERARVVMQYPDRVHAMDAVLTHNDWN